MQAVHKFFFRGFLVLTVLVFLLLQIGTGNAQDETATPTILDESSVTPIWERIDATETTTVVESEATVTPTSTVEVQWDDDPLTVQRLLIKKTSTARLEKVMERVEPYGKVIENTSLNELGVFILEIPSGTPEEMISSLRNVSGVEIVEPDYSIQTTDTIPNDPSFSSQYALTSIHASQGWDYSTGSPSVIIAILDSGVDLAHPELAGKIVQGYDFVNNDYIPQDDYGHGTHAAGIAGAIGNNGIGIAGISWGAQIMPVKVLNATGGGSYSNAAAGIVWAANAGAQIINMSFGGTNDSQILHDAVRYAFDRGILLIAASGNSNSNFILYPAAFPEVMAVAATDMSDQRASFSNYGPEVEIAAPGVTILSLWPGGGYRALSGTSMAAPHVSGVAAILLGIGYNAGAARERIVATALDILPAGSDIYTGSGLIQLDAALQPVITPPTPTQYNQPGPPPPILIPTQIWTLTLQPTSDFASITPVLATPTLQIYNPSPTHTSKVILETAQTPEIRDQTYPFDFRLTLFCSGILLILMGILAFWMYHKTRQNTTW